MVRMCSLASKHLSFGRSQTARLGVTECVKHDLVEPYKVMLEEGGRLFAIAPALESPNC